MGDSTDATPRLVRYAGKGYVWVLLLLFTLWYPTDPSEVGLIVIYKCLIYKLNKDDDF